MWIFRVIRRNHFFPFSVIKNRKSSNSKLNQQQQAISSGKINNNNYAQSTLNQNKSIILSSIYVFVRHRSQSYCIYVAVAMAQHEVLTRTNCRKKNRKLRKCLTWIIAERLNTKQEWIEWHKCIPQNAESNREKKKKEEIIVSNDRHIVLSARSTIGSFMEIHHRSKFTYSLNIKWMTFLDVAIPHWFSYSSNSSSTKQNRQKREKISYKIKKKFETKRMNNSDDMCIRMKKQ